MAAVRVAFAETIHTVKSWFLVSLGVLAGPKEEVAARTVTELQLNLERSSRLIPLASVGTLLDPTKQRTSWKQSSILLKLAPAIYLATIAAPPTKKCPRLN